MGASEKMRQILVNEGNLLGVGGIARPISVEVKPNNISAVPYLRRLRRLLGLALLNRSDSWPLAVGELDASTPWFDVELGRCQSV